MHTKIVVTRALALLLFVAVGSTCGQASPGNVPAALPPASGGDELAPLPLVNPAIEELRTHPYLQVRALNIRRVIRTARPEQAQVHEVEETANAIQKLAAGKKQDVAVTLKNQKRITGRLLSAGALEFTVRVRETRQETAIRYDEVAEWRAVQTPGAQAAQTTLRVLITIPLFPLFFLAGLAGWDGC